MKRVRLPHVPLPPLESPAVPFVLGLVLLSVGLSWAWLPLGPIGAGAVLLYVALAGDREQTP